MTGKLLHCSRMPTPGESAPPPPSQFHVVGVQFDLYCCRHLPVHVPGIFGQDTSGIRHEPVAKVSFAFCHSSVSLTDAVKYGSGAPSACWFVQCTLFHTHRRSYIGHIKSNLLHFRRICCRLIYIDIVKHIYIQSWMVTEIMTLETCDFCASTYCICLTWYVIGILCMLVRELTAKPSLIHASSCYEKYSEI
jgi:hypothetical protein